MAAKSGQASQLELLIVYGADIQAKDSSGNSAYDIAKQNKHLVIADRLIEATYEVTDRLTHFLIGKKPDHTTANHLLIPDQSNTEISEQLKIARGKLQLIPNKMFEELVMDLYDEVDRRETEASEYTNHCSQTQPKIVKKLFNFKKMSKNYQIFIYSKKKNYSNSLGNKCIKSGNRCRTISTNKSAFECNKKSGSSKIGPI